MIQLLDNHDGHWRITIFVSVRMIKSIVLFFLVHYEVVLSLTHSRSGLKLAVPPGLYE